MDTINILRNRQRGSLRYREANELADALGYDTVWRKHKERRCDKTRRAAHRAPDCVTAVRMGNTILTVPGYFKQSATETAADKMMKVLKIDTELQKTEIS